MMVYAELSRASKNYECSRCRAQIKRGSLYVLWRRPYVRGPNTEKYCLKCAKIERENMLKNSVSALFIYMNEEGFVTGVVPRRDRLLCEEHRKVLEAVVKG
jgi:hypothetical protein